MCVLILCDLRGLQSNYGCCWFRGSKRMCSIWYVKAYYFFDNYFFVVFILTENLKLLYNSLLWHNCFIWIIQLSLLGALKSPLLVLTYYLENFSFHSCLSITKTSVFTHFIHVLDPKHSLELATKRNTSSIPGEIRTTLIISFFHGLHSARPIEQ